MRSASALRFSPSRRRLRPDRKCTAASPPPSTGAATRLSPPSAASRIDAWIDPPPYAGRPPVVIDFKTADPQTLTVPEDSVLVVRGDPSLVETRVEGGISPSEQKGAAPEQEGAAPGSAPTERRWTVHGDGKATILRGGGPAAVVVLDVTPAGAPTIATTEDPRANLSGSLTLAYRTSDRFGLASARADFARPHEGAGPAPRTLAPPPQAALQLPPTANGVGDAQHDRRPLRAPLGGRQGDDDAERGQRFGQDRRERADRGDAAAANLPQSRWRARSSNSAATSFSTPTMRQSASRRR